MRCKYVKRFRVEFQEYMIGLGKNIVGVGCEKSGTATGLACQKHYTHAKISRYIKDNHAQNL